MSNSVNKLPLPLGKNTQYRVATPKPATVQAVPQATVNARMVLGIPAGQPAAAASAEVPAVPGSAVAPGMEVPRSVPIRYRRKQIQQLAQTGATLGEIAALLRTSAKKLSPANRRDFRFGRALLQQALRRQQLTMAAIKEPDLRLIFMLGKEYLKQGKDKGVAPGVREPEKTYLNVRMHEI